jgi:hypothetical protein
MIHLNKSMTMKSIKYTILFSLLACTAALTGQEITTTETLPGELQINSITVEPAVMEFNFGRDYRQLRVTGQLESGQIADLTRMLSVPNTPQHVQISADGIVTPISIGQETVTLQFGKYSATLAITVKALEQTTSSFINDVQPILAKMGCNAGTCHGSKDGKNGFKLSLRGYDPLYDHRALTDDIGARRFNRAAPDQSLLLLKAIGAIPHVGGVRTTIDSRYYSIVRDWITQGGGLDLDTQKATSIEIFPKNPIIPRAGMKQQISVLATYPDGSIRDVTREAFIESGNIEVIDADERGVLTLLRRGEGPVLVRYDGNYAATTLTVMGDRAGFKWEKPKTQNYIDDLVYDKLERVKILPADICSDEDFVRRIYIDITGLPPTVAQVREFLESEQPTEQRRNNLIDELVGSKEYIEHWTNRWADLLQVNRKFLGEEGAIALRNWIKQSVAVNKPYNQFAHEVLTANGSTLDNPPAAYYKIIRDPETLMENTTHLFLAVRFNCNKCHDHPFERWTQDQYYSLAAFFSQIGRKEDARFTGKKIGGSAVEGAKPLVEVIFNSGAGEVTHLRTTEVAPPSFPYEHQDAAGEELPRLEKLAHWITSSDNQYFASSYVNRLWGYMFGVGIIEPIDDIRAGNPPTNPELLDALTNDFVKSGFDVQHMLRTICKSRVYQHTVATNQWNAGDEINYSHAIARRLPAEVLFDAIHVATGSTQGIPGVPKGFRAAELPDVGVKVPFLDDFGRPVRESACECERSTGLVLGPIMKLVNGPTIATALADPSNALFRMAAEFKDDESGDEKLIEEVFLRFLSRYPSDQEIQIGKLALSEAGSDYLELRSELDELDKDIPRRQQEWEAGLNRVNKWGPTEFVSGQTDQETKLELRDDGIIWATGKNQKSTYTIQLKTELANLTAIRLEALSDDSLPGKGPGRSPSNGNFVLSEFSIGIQPANGEGEVQAVKLMAPSATFNQGGYDVAKAIDGNPDTGWAIAPQQGKNHTAVFQTDGEVGFEGGCLITLTIVNNFTDDAHQLGKFRISVSDSDRPVTLKTFPADLTALLNIPVAERNEKQQADLRTKYLATDKQYQSMSASVAAIKIQYDNKRVTGLQDLAWALINNPAFLFNR